MRSQGLHTFGSIYTQICFSAKLKLKLRCPDVQREVLVRAQCSERVSEWRVKITYLQPFTNHANEWRLVWRYFEPDNADQVRVWTPQLKTSNRRPSRQPTSHQHNKWNVSQVNQLGVNPDFRWMRLHLLWLPCCKICHASKTLDSAKPTFSCPLKGGEHWEEDGELGGE